MLLFTILPNSICYARIPYTLNKSFFFLSYYLLITKFLKILVQILIYIKNKEEHLRNKLSPRR